jgi:hypothetical protein
MFLPNFNIYYITSANNPSRIYDHIYEIARNQATKKPAQATVVRVIFIVLLNLPQTKNQPAVAFLVAWER